MQKNRQKGCSIKDMKKQRSNQFCLDLNKLGIKHAKATANLVMTLASDTQAQSPVALSLSPVYHYQNTSVSDAITNLADDAESYPAVQQEVRSLVLKYYRPLLGESNRVVLQTDSTSIRKPHSPTLEGRTMIGIPNTVVPGNRPLDIGYEVSYINLSDMDSSWSMPLHIERVGWDETATNRALAQIEVLMEESDLAGKLVINTLDSKYGNVYYLHPAYGYDRLVNVVRLRAGMKVWSAAPSDSRKVYGEKFYLHAPTMTKSYKRHPQTHQPYEVVQRSISEHPWDDYQSFDTVLKNGRAVQVELWRWNELLLRTKDGLNMKDKPFDLLAIKVTDPKTGKLVFKRQMYVAIFGKQKDQLQTKESYHIYRHRYDIEPFLRFSKQKQLLEKYQTPDVQHFDNWLLIQQLTTCLLYTASEEATFIPRKWQSYDPKNKQAQNAPRLSIAQTKWAAQNLFLTFDQTPFQPLKSKKGKPRQKGETQIKRIHHPYVKKPPRKPKIMQATLASQ